MTATNRHRSSSSEKSAASSQDDAPKSQTSANGSGVRDSGPQGPRSGSCLGLVATTVFYIALIGVTGFTAFYLQKVAEEIRQVSASQEKSARHNANMGTKMETVIQEINVLRRVVDGLESAMGVTRGKLDGIISQIKRNELETRRVEEALQKLQDDLSSEESADSLPPSASDFITSTVESLLAKYDAAESTLAAQAVEEVKTGLEQEMEALKSSLGKLQSNMAALGDAQTKRTSKDSDMDQQVTDLQERLTTLEDSSSEEPDFELWRP